MESFPSKSYAIYNGRKPGVYNSWVDCYAQVNRWQDSIVRLYDTRNEGDLAWISFANSISTTLTKKSDIECAIKMNNGYSNEIIDAMGVPHGIHGRVKHRQREGVLIEHNMKNLLRDACFQMRIEQPLYTLHEVKVFDGKRHYNFHSSIANKSLGKPQVSLGNYAPIEYDARENVVLLLLRRLLSCNRKIILDYNQHNVELLESQQQRACEFNFELRMENAVLTEELWIVRNQLLAANE